MSFRIALVVSAAITLCSACSADVESSGGLGGSTSGAGGSSGRGGGSGSGGEAAGGRSAGSQSSVGGSGAASSTGGGGSSQIVCDAQGACGGCVAEACPDTWCACAANPECFALFGCMAPCAGDSACIQDCLAQHPDGISDVILSTDCAKTSCAADCPDATGEPLTPCETCLYSTCPTAMNDCLGEPECLALFGCLDPCGNTDLSCQNDCYNAHPNGLPPLEAVLDCSTMQCSSSCP